MRQAEVRPRGAEDMTAKFDLSLVMVEGGDSITGASSTTPTYTSGRA